MDMIQVKAEKRTDSGSASARRLRLTGHLPAVMYGGGAAAVSLSLHAKDFQTAMKKAGANAIYELQFEGEKTKHTTLIKEIQKDVVTNAWKHVDFNEVSLKEKITVWVQVHAVGQPKGVVEGGILDHVHREVEVECLPTDIPERIDVDVSALEIGDSIHVGKISFPQGVVCLMDEEETVLAVVAPAQEEGAEDEEPAAAEPEVIKKAKADESAS